MTLLNLVSLKDSSFLVLSIVATLVILGYRLYLARQFPEELSLVSEKPNTRHFSIKSRLSFYFDCSTLYRDVWTEFSKKGLPVLVPTLGTRKDIFLPHSSIPWAVSQPANVLGMWEAFNEMFQLGHSLGHEKYMLDTWTVDVSRKVLTQDLEDVIGPVWEELQLAVDRYLGLDTENWQTLDLLETVRNIVNRASGRFVVGLSLCRNEDYLATVINSIDSVVTNAGATGFMPACVRPFFGRLACWKTRSMLSELESFIKPMIGKRLAHIAANPDESSDDFDLEQRMLRYAYKHRPSELKTDELTRRLVMTNLGFVYQGSFAASNMVRNIIQSDAKYDTITTLREEAKHFMASNPDASRLWRRQNTDRMVFADSVARESLRLNTVPTRALVRQVMVNGLKTNTGLPLPKGSLISFVSQPMHTDPDLFPDPNTFDPYRFVRLREADDAAKKADTDDTGTRSPHSFLSTSNLLIFGRGRNSCPGRYFVDFQLKMLIAYLFTNYDIEFVDSGKPVNKWVLEFIFPSKGVQMRVKRRVKAFEAVSI